MNQYRFWITYGDYFILNYINTCCLGSGIPKFLAISEINLFFIYHALECYIKAAILFAKIELNQNHNIFDNIKQIRKHYPDFLSEVSITDDAYREYSFTFVKKKLKEETLHNIYYNQSILMLLKYGIDFRYPVIHKKRKKEIESGGYGYGYTTFDPTYTKIFKEIRELVKYKETDDLLKIALSEKKIIKSDDEFYYSRQEFLRKCLNDTTF